MAYVFREWMEFSSVNSFKIDDFFKIVSGGAERFIIFNDETEKSVRAFFSERNHSGRSYPPGEVLENAHKLILRRTEGENYISAEGVLCYPLTTQHPWEIVEKFTELEFQVEFYEPGRGKIISRIYEDKVFAIEEEKDIREIPTESTLMCGGGWLLSEKYISTLPEIFYEEENSM